MKEKLVIIHGWGVKKDQWNEAIKYLDDFEVILLDIPGFDLELERPFNFDDYLNFLEKEINFGQFYLLGHSFGGALAMLYTLKHPEKIKKLILYNAAIIRDKKLKRKISVFISKIFKFLEKIFPEKLLYLPKKAYYKFIIKSYDYLMANENLKKTFINIINTDLKDLPKNLKVETILLWGKYDKTTPLKHGEILKNLIPNSKLIVLEGGHNVHVKNPEEFAQKLKGALL
jgi:pimeloyl-ACP methyl ester carboxylesterase